MAAAGEVAVQVCGVATLVGVASSVPGEAPAYVPASHRYLGAPAQIPVARLRELLGPLLADPAVRNIVHDVI